jgi:glycosyltransferase involved in cell wall biosynthesis
MSFYSVPDDFTAHDGLRRRLLVRFSIASSTRILTISDFSRREIVHYFPAAAPRVRTIHLAADADLPLPPSRDDARRRLGVTGPMLLSVGSILNRRHVPVLLEAVRGIARSWPGLVLDIVGENRTHPRIDVAALCRRLGIEKNVRLSGFVDDATLARRYAAADVVVYISDYEGFGLPVLEALSRGLPVITSRRPATGELFGEAALLAEPDDAAEIARRLQEVLGDARLREELLQKGPALAARFSWERTAAQTRAVLQEAIGA